VLIRKSCADREIDSGTGCGLEVHAELEAKVKKIAEIVIPYLAANDVRTNGRTTSALSENSSRPTRFLRASLLLSLPGNVSRIPFAPAIVAVPIRVVVLLATNEFKPRHRRQLPPFTQVLVPLPIRQIVIGYLA
jgi:hypothetical protein